MGTQSAMHGVVPLTRRSAAREASAARTEPSLPITEAPSVAEPALREPVFLQTAKYHRLRATIVAFEHEWQTGTLATERRVLAPQVDALIRTAWQELKERNYPAGWAALQSASRIRMQCATRRTLEAWAMSLATESEEKLSGWRLEAARELLSFVDEAATKGKPPATTSDADEAPHGDHLARAHEAQRLLDSRAQNVYAKQRLILNRALALLAVLLSLIILASALMSRFGLPQVDGPVWLCVVLIGMFGAMGASFSGLRSICTAASKSVPDLILSGAFTCMRPAIGAAAAMIVWLAHAGGIIRFAEGGGPGLLTLAFVAGFSDALVVRVVGAFDKKS